VVGKGAHEDVAAKDEAAEKRELNADALVVEEVKKDVLVEEEKQSEEEVGLLASLQDHTNLRVVPNTKNQLY